MIEKAPGIAFRCVTRIPFIWSWPGHLPKSEVRDSLVESIDFVPTICDLIGIPEPNWVDGENIRTILREGGEVRDIAVTENPITKTVHTKRYKLTQYLPEMCDGKDFGELYDLEKDPWELTNLYFDPEYQSVIQDLRYRLYCWLIRTQRYITVNPKAPDKEWNEEWGRTWELATDLHDEDGRLGFSFIEKMLERDWINYL
jgi:arylsulfatase A-like enzyme